MGNGVSCTGKIRTTDARQGHTPPSSRSSSSDDVLESESSSSSDARQTPNTVFGQTIEVVGSHAQPSGIRSDDPDELDFRGHFDFEQTAWKPHEVEIPKRERSPTFGQTRRALSGQPKPPQLGLNPGGNIGEFWITGNPNKRLASSIVAHLQRRGGQGVSVSLTSSGDLKIEGAYPDLHLTFMKIQKLRVFG